MWKWTESSRISTWKLIRCRVNAPATKRLHDKGKATPRPGRPAEVDIRPKIETTYINWSLLKLFENFHIIIWIMDIWVQKRCREYPSYSSTITGANSPLSSSPSISSSSTSILPPPSSGGKSTIPFLTY